MAEAFIARRPGNAQTFFRGNSYIRAWDSARGAAIMLARLVVRRPSIDVELCGLSRMGQSEGRVRAVPAL
jgi:hypothetical protein